MVEKIGLALFRFDGVRNRSCGESCPVGHGVDGLLFELDAIDKSRTSSCVLESRLLLLERLTPSSACADKDVMLSLLFTKFNAAC